MTKHKSMRGVEVDVDLIRMKQELMAGKKTEPNIKREDYVSDRRRRSSSKRIDEMFANEQIVRQKLAEQKNSEKITPTMVVGETEKEIEPALLEEFSLATEESSAQAKVRTIRKHGQL